MKRKKHDYKNEMTNNQPIVRFIFDQIDQKKLSLKDLGRDAGVTGSTLSSWRTKTTPNVQTAEAVLNCLGYTLKIEKLHK